MWRKIISLTAVLALLAQTACSGSRAISMDDPDPQASARIILKDGSTREGIIVKKEKNQLIYVDAKTHKAEKLDLVEISKMYESDHIYDFSAKPIPDSEVRAYKSSKKTWLYGAGGLILGLAAGFGVGLLIISSDADQTLAANIAMGTFGVAGAWIFASVGANQDFEDAVFKARKARYQVEKRQMDKEKKKLEELKKEKERLLKKKAEKEGK
ncbi:MAG TPA: hypothetical protein EYP36_07520 [Calditrichaeota bacterium]|nr:hypothetical protein [Calditrichota bacterium]